jgi:membrane-associated protease RseP (regulator of RpoE activity)
VLAAWVGWAVFVLLLFLDGLAVYALYRAGRLGPDRSLQLLGPLLMMKTKRGLGLLDRLGRFKRFWSRMSDAGLVLAAAGMLGIVVTLCLEAVLVFGIGGSRAPTPAEAVGLPGINPFIPVGYGILALIVGVVVHELFHGIVARSQNIGVKSVGILWLVIPLGAFVEQDEAQMNAAPRRARDRVGAAGILANFLITFVTFLLLALLLTTSVHAVTNGVQLAEIVSGTPAAGIGLHVGDIITQLNGTATTTVAIFEKVLAGSHPGQTMSLTWWSVSQSRYLSGTVTLTKDPYVAGRGFLGVAASVLTPTGLLSEMAAPWSNPSGTFFGLITWISLPFLHFSPIQGVSVNYYQATGPLAGLGVGNVLILVNVLYWLAWMNLLLGLSNALPLIPLDGNLLFRDWVAAITARVKKGWTMAQLDRFSAQMTVAASLLIVFLIIWSLTAEYL